MIARTLLRAFVANACLAAPSVACAQAMPPPADMKLAHDIYKQFIETRLDRTPVRPSGQRA